MSTHLGYEKSKIAPEFDVKFYRNQSPALSDDAVDPIIHYLEKGWREMRDPSPGFSTAYYLEAHADVRKSGINPLLHYVESGRLEGRAKHPDDNSAAATHLAYERDRIGPDFDKEFYLQQVPALRGGSVEPIVHFLEQGWRELRDPSPQFSTAFYLSAHADVREQGINPLLHYVESGRPEGRTTGPAVINPPTVETVASEIARSDTQTIAVTQAATADKSALALPAQQPITHVTINDGGSVAEKSASLIASLADALGNFLIFDIDYYRNKYAVLGSAANVISDYLAHPMRAASPYFDPTWYLEQHPDAGPPGFAPLNHYLTLGKKNGLRPSPIFDGSAIDMSADEIKRVISESGLFDPMWYAHTSADVVRAGADPLVHYSRVGSREYKRSPNALFDNTFYLSQAMDIREYKWHPLVHYIMLGSFKSLAPHPLIDAQWCEQIVSTDGVAESMLSRILKGIAHNGTGPNRFFDPKFYLAAHLDAKEYPGGAIGHYMEVGWKKQFDPSERFSTAGYAQANPDVRASGSNPFLHFMLTGRAEGRNPKPAPASIPATLERFSEPEYGADGPLLKFDAEVALPEAFALSVAVHLHLYYTEMSQEFCRYLSNIPVPFHLFISVPPGRGDPDKIKATFVAGVSNCSSVTVASPENRGRDVAPFLVEFGQQLLTYDLVLHLHSKRSPHSPKHADWRRYLLHYTLGNRSIVTQILTAFFADPKIGIFQPPYHPETRAQPKWGDNRDIIQRLLPRFGLSYVGDSCPHFPAGSFFWVRTDAIRPLLDGRLRLEDFDTEAGQIDSTVAHALERLFGLIPILRGYSVISRFIDVAHNLVNYYGKSRAFHGFERDRTADIITYQNGVRARNGKRGRIAVVTTISGPFDALLLPYYLEPSVDYFCVSDAITDGYGTFRIVPPPYIDGDARRTARYVKTNLLRLFPGYEFVVWVDANVLIRARVSDFVAATEKSGCPIGAIPHPTRRFYTEEAAVAIEMKLDDADLIKTQLKTYEGIEGLDKSGLIETNFMVFDARKPETKRFAQLWWNAINTYSRRDQLSINYCLIKSDVEWHPLLPEYLSVRDADAFSLFRHGLNEWGPKPHIYDAWHRPNALDGHLLPLPELHRWSKQAGRLDLDVVVCVHNALDDVRACLASVEIALNGRGKLIVVDDASMPETQLFLAEYAGTGAALLVRLDERSGYTKAANAGVRASSNRHVLLLNSDTIVPAGALDKLSDALDRNPLLGIVGPLSNAASHQSVPSTANSGLQTAINQIPPGMSPTDMDRFLERRWDGTIIRVPLVHGFCFCVKREVFDAIGLFDEENFPRGYGEENDFCFRTMDAGFDLGILTSTYVFHAKSKSYGNEERETLMSEGMAALIRKATKPRISRSVQTMSRQPGLAAVRDAVAPLFESPAVLRPERRGRLFLLPSLRSDGLPAGSGYVRVLLPYMSDAMTQAREVIELRTPSLPALTSQDTVLVQRDAAVIASAAISEWIAAVRQSGARLLYEIDDDLLDGEALRRRGFRGDTADMAMRVLAFARAADCITVSSDALKKKFSLIGQDVRFVPNALDADLWGLGHPGVLERLSAGVPASNGRVTIGYVGTPTHDDDLAIVGHVLADLRDRFPGRVDIQVVGGFGQGKKSFGSVIPLPVGNDYPSFVRWLRQTVRWDIGIIPLANSSFNANKSYLKFLECGALGMALVCSKGPEYNKVVRHGETGLLVANTRTDWNAALTALITNPGERIRLARNAYEDVYGSHTMTRVALQLERLVSTGEDVYENREGLIGHASESAVSLTRWRRLLGLRSADTA